MLSRGANKIEEKRKRDDDGTTATTTGDATARRFVPHPLSSAFAQVKARNPAKGTWSDSSYGARAITKAI